MKKTLLFLILSQITGFMLADIGHLYTKTHSAPHSSYEEMLVRHTRDSYERAMRKESKLNDSRLSTPEFFKDIENTSPHGLTPYLHLVNNLCTLKGASHLHIGLYTGASFISALFGNEETLSEKVGIDWYVDNDIYNNTWKHKEICLNACDKYLQQKDHQIVVGDCFTISESIFTKPVDIYVYDAGHSKLDQEMAFTYYNNVFAKTFVAIVDDWAWERVRKGTFNAFDKLHYDILYQCEIPHADSIGNGQYIAVIRKNG